MNKSFQNKHDDEKEETQLCITILGARHFENQPNSQGTTETQTTGMTNNASSPNTN